MAQVDYLKDFKMLHELHEELLKYLMLKRAKVEGKKFKQFDSKVRFEYEQYLQRLASLAECDIDDHCPNGRCPPCDPDLDGHTRKYLNKLKKHNQAAAAKKAGPVKQARARK